MTAHDWFTFAAGFAIGVISTRAYFAGRLQAYERDLRRRMEERDEGEG